MVFYVLVSIQALLVCERPEVGTTRPCHHLLFLRMKSGCDLLSSAGTLLPEKKRAGLKCIQQLMPVLTHVTTTLQFRNLRISTRDSPTI